jgi:hypothetical protein
VVTLISASQTTDRSVARVTVSCRGLNKGLKNVNFCFNCCHLFFEMCCLIIHFIQNIFIKIVYFVMFCFITNIFKI